MRLLSRRRLHVPRKTPEDAARARGRDDGPGDGDALVDDVALCGPKERIAERLELWRACPITTMNIITFTLEGWGFSVQGWQSILTGPTAAVASW